MGDALLRLERVAKNFGGLLALNRVSFSVPSGAIKALIGPNGAGKTTAFNLIAGIYAPSSGTIHFDGRRIDGHAPIGWPAWAWHGLFKQSGFFLRSVSWRT